MIHQRQFASEQNKTFAMAKDAFVRLKANPKDAFALMALYEAYGRELQEIAVHHFGKTQLARKAFFNLLVAVVSRASTWDLETSPTKKWILECATVEAKKLGAALGTTSSQDRCSFSGDYPCRIVLGRSCWRR